MNTRIIFSFLLAMGCSLGANAQTAQINNFAPVDILAGNDGLTPNSKAPLIYGTPVLHLDKNGNGIEEHAATINYFDGKYYMYAEKWGGGKVVKGVDPKTGNPIQNKPAKNAGVLGLATYVSSDLVHWKELNIFQPQQTKGTASKPHVLYSPKLKKYVMWFKAGSNFVPTGGLFVAFADSPSGPWSGERVATGDHLGHDFDIMEDENGVAYVVSDPFSGKYDMSRGTKGAPLWDVYFQQMNDEKTGISTDPKKSFLVMKDADFEALGLFKYGENYYITGGPTCGNCQVPISYVRSRSPFTKWRNEEGETGENLKTGTVIAPDGYTGQNKGADMLPSHSGPIVLAGIWGYRTNPESRVKNGRVVHGSNSQALASTYWYPLQFSADGKIKQMKGTSSVRVPLVKGSMTPEPLPFYQPDARIRKGNRITQRGTIYAKGGKLNFSMFMLLDESSINKGESIVNQPLKLTVTFTDGTEQKFSKDASEFGFAPLRTSFVLDSRNIHKKIKSVTFSSESDNGAYGVMVEPNADRKLHYSCSVNMRKIEAPKARLAIFN